MQPPQHINNLLLTSLALGARQLANRIIFGAHCTNFGKGNVFTPRHVAYYQARAAGGAAMIVSESLTVHPLDWPYEHIPFGHTNRIIPSLKTLKHAIASVSPQCLLVGQLNHHGCQQSGKLLRQSPWAPSAMMDVSSRVMSRTIEIAEIAEVVAGYADTAQRVTTQGGWDGIELNAGQDSLMRQFLSPLTNHRSDHYGGDLKNRLRFLLETLHAVGSMLLPDKILGIKLCGDELAPWGGLTIEDATSIAQTLLATDFGHSIDYLSIQIGGPFSAHVTEAAMPTPQGHAAHLAATIKTALNHNETTIFAEGRIETPDSAADILSNQQADAVVMTRGLISEPALPNILSSWQKQNCAAPNTAIRLIRPHVGMLRYFAVRGDWNRPLGDLSNAEAGREKRFQSLLARFHLGQQTRQSSGTIGALKALVVGAGPAGMESALILSEQGVHVTVWEKSMQLGGMAAHIGETIEVRKEYSRLVDFYQSSLAQLGTAIHFERPLESWLPELLQFDLILVACGVESDPTFPFTVDRSSAVFSPRALLKGECTLPSPKQGTILVVDDEGSYRMACTVEWLLQRGYATEVITADLHVGKGLVESAEIGWFQSVVSQGVSFHPRLVAEHFGEGVLQCRPRFLSPKGDGNNNNGNNSQLGDYTRYFNGSALVYAQPETSGNHQHLLHMLRAHHPAVYTVGDARAPRLMGEAIAHARITALEQALHLL